MCPRQFCNRCWHIEAGWKRNSPTKRRSLKVDDGRVHLSVCCPLCWKRGWDFSNPLLGPDQPEWDEDSDVLHPPKEDVLLLRHKNWESGAKTKIFSWRKPLLTHKDDMTLESDRDLLRGMLKAFQKNPKRFKLFDKDNVAEATAEEHTFDLYEAFTENWRHLIENVSATNSEEETTEAAMVEVKRGPGRPKRKSRPPGWYIVEEPIEPDGGTPLAAGSVEDKSLTPDTAGRPRRQAARLSFASGIPVPRAKTSSKDEESEEMPAPRRLKSRASKIVVLPVSLPTSPETAKNNAQSVIPGSGRVSSVSSHNSIDLTTTDAAPDVAVQQSESHAIEEPQSEIGKSIHIETRPPALQGPPQNGLDTAPPLPLGDSREAATDPLEHATTSQDLDRGRNLVIAASNEHIGQTHAQLLELQKQHAALQEDRDLLDTKYRRWRSGVVENSKLIFEQEEDLAAKKVIISDLNKAVKQLSSDNARLGAELALARGMVVYNPELLKSTLLKFSLAPDVVERLFSNPDFIELLQPRPANNGEIVAAQPLPNSESVRPKKRRRITAADAANDAEAEEARQKKLTRVIAPTIKRLEKTRFNLSATDVENVFDADTAESKRFLDSLIDFSKLPISFDEALVLIREAQQDRKQGRVVVPQLRLSDPTWAPWDVKTAQKRYMQQEGMVENEHGDVVREKPISVEDMVADAKAAREAAAKELSLIEVEETMISEDDSQVLATDETGNTSASRQGGRSESRTRRVWERHEELRREREQREQELQQATQPPLDMTDPLQVLAANVYTNGTGSGSKARGRPPGMNGRRRSGSPKQYQRREPSEDVEMDDSYDQPMELSESP